jgi:hypothetical protein
MWNQVSLLPDGCLDPSDLHLPPVPHRLSHSTPFASSPLFPASPSSSPSSSNSLSWNCPFLDCLSPSWTVWSRGPNWPVRVHLVPKNSGARVVNNALDLPKKWREVGIQTVRKRKEEGRRSSSSVFFHRIFKFIL